MATILPFRGIRPTRDKVQLVASRSVDNYGRSDLNEKLRTNPYSFLHVIHPDFNDGRRTKPGSPERLRKVRAQYDTFRTEGIFHRDEQPCYYVYRQEKLGNTFTGIIACTSIDDYTNGVIRIHEQTLTQREQKLKEYLDVCQFNAEPVLFCYPDNPGIEQIIAKKVQEREEYDFSTTDRVRHHLWIISDPAEVDTIRKHFAGIPSVYIADGHHRSASSALLGQSMRAKNPEHTGSEPWNFYLGVFFPETQMKIFDFNRVVKDLNGLSDEEFLQQLENEFTIVPHHENMYRPEQKHVFSMYIGGNWYGLRLKNSNDNSDEPVASLDAYILTQRILSPLLGIHDLKTDPRIGFVSGIKGAEELKNQVDNWKFKVAFGLFPVQMDELKHIADTGSIMPPKTTWVEPKMRSGLVIYSLND